MSSVDGNFSNGSVGVAKTNFDIKEERAQAQSAAGSVSGLKDKAANLKGDISASESDPTVYYSLLADEQDKKLESEAFGGNGDAHAAAQVQEKERQQVGISPVPDSNEVEDLDGDDVEKNQQSGPKDDPLGLGKLGYSKEQVDGWISQGFSIGDIKSGLAAKKTAMTEEQPESSLVNPELIEDKNKIANTVVATANIESIADA